MDRDPSEIAKLAERIAKDPKSKLFVPLAEEYKKAGDIDMAIHVLREGLKNNPGYVTARSFLGRLLIEKGDLSGAQKEFEDVIKAIPDNLLAQKKLGDLYAVQGRTQDALTRYRMVISLNARDQETLALISDLEAGKDVSARISLPKPQAQAEKEPAPETKTAPSAPPQSPAPAVAAKPEQAPPPAVPPFIQQQTEAPQKEEPAAETPAPPRDARAENAGGYDFLAEGKMTPDGEQLRGLEVSVPGGFFEEVSSVVEAPAPEKPETAAFEGQIEPAGGTLKGLEVSVPGGFFEEAQQPPAEEGGKKTGDEFAEGAEPEAGTTEKTFVPAPVGTAEGGKAPLLVDSTAGEAGPPEVVRAARPAAATVPEPPAAALKKPDDFTTDTLAELYITQGFYEKAIDIYERMLADNPGHQGLIDKLSRLRRSAAEQESSETGTPVQAREPEPPSASFDLSDTSTDTHPVPDSGGTEYVPPPFGAEEQPNAAAAAFPFEGPEAREYIPPAPAAEAAGDENLSAGGFDLSEGMFDASHEGKRGAPEETVQAARPEPASPVFEAKPTPGIAAPVREPRKKRGGPDNAKRKTMSSLEQWLNNITKEK